MKCLNASCQKEINKESKECSECNETFCSICSKNYSTTYKCRDHIMEKCLNITEIICPYCKLKTKKLSRH